MHPLVSYSIPALVVGVLGGFFVSDLVGVHPARGLDSEARQGALTRTDLDRVAEVCAAQVPQADHPRTIRITRAETSEDATSDEVALTRSQLTDVEEQVLDYGMWSRGAGFKARSLLRKLPPHDASLLRERIDAAVEEGDIRVQPGAWLPSR